MKQKNKARSSRTIHNLRRVSLVIIFLSSFDSSANNIVSVGQVDAIQSKQIRAIEAGARIGKLTPKETRELLKEQREITNIECDMKADGVLSASELEELFKKLEYAQNNINRLLRNNISSRGFNSFSVW